MITKGKLNIKYGMTLSLIILIIVNYFIFYFKPSTITLKEHFNTRKADDKITDNAGVSNLDVLLIGDIMLDRHIRKTINKLGIEGFKTDYIPELIEFNKGFDYVVANLEGPITDNESLTLNPDGSFNKELLFTFDPLHASILNDLNIKAASLANNHTDNFYNDGLQSTKSYLKKYNINYFGNPYNLNKEEKLSETICEKSICIAYVGYHQFTKDNSPAIVLQEISKLKEQKENGVIDFIVVIPHWGEEYSMEANNFQKSTSHKWIDAGADLVIGAHPHVIQESEFYNGKHIFYSLGNYIFDQWFRDDVRYGLTVPVKFEVTKTNKGDGTYNISRSFTIGTTTRIYTSRDKIEILK